MKRLIRQIRRFWPVLLAVIMVISVLFAYPAIITRYASSPPQVYAQAQPTPAAGLTSTSLRTITVSGNGSVDITPDMAIVTLGVQTDAQTASQALTQNNTQMQAVMSALQKAGIASADIQTSFVQLSPRYENPPPQQPQQGPAQTTPSVTVTATVQPVTYTAINTVQVKVRKLDTLGTLLDQVVAAGGNQIQNIRFDVSNASQAMDQARQAAMNDAIHKAQQLATLANAKLGTVMTINETSQSPVPFAAAMQAQPSAGNVPVSPGTQTVTVDLQVTWDLQAP